MKRKVLATFLTACMAVGMLAGCGGQGGGQAAPTHPLIPQRKIPQEMRLQQKRAAKADPKAK